MARKRLLFVWTLLLAAATPCFAMQRYQISCEQGGNTVSTQGLTSTTKVQQSFPSCTVTVYLSGTVTLAPNLYSDDGVTPLGNPFTASSADGSGGFNAPDGVYDVQYSGGGIASPFTRGGITLTSNQPVAVNCATQPGADPGAKLNACIAALPSTGGIADACSVPPAAIATTVSVSKPVEFRFCSGAFTGSVSPMFLVAADLIMKSAGWDTTFTAQSGGMIIFARGPAKHFEVESVRFIGNGADSRGIQFAAYQEQIDQVANSGIVRLNNVVTATFGERCSLIAGDAVVTENVIDTSFDGNFTVLTSCEDSVGHNQITYAQIAADASSGLGDVRRSDAHGWDRSLISMNNTWWTDFGNWAVWFGQSVYMDYISNSKFQDNNGSVWEEHASDLFIRDSFFEFTNYTAHTNPHVSLKSGSKATVTNSEFLNNGANLTAAGVPDIQVEAADLGGNSGWITIGPGNKFGPEGETTSRPKIRVSSTRGYGNSGYSVFNVRIIDNDFGGAIVSPKELAAIYVANPIYNMTVDLNHFSLFQYAINDTQALSSAENAGNSIFGGGNQFYTGLASFGSDMRQFICVNGCRQFSEVKGKLYVGDDYRSMFTPFPRWTETEKLQNRLLQSADMTNTTYWGLHNRAASISTIARSGGTVSVTCATVCYPAATYPVTIASVPVGSNTFNGSFTVVTATDSTHFTYTQAGADESKSSGTATLYDTKVTAGQTDPKGNSTAVLISSAANGGNSANIHSVSSDNTGRTNRLVDKVWMKAGTCTQVSFGLFDLTASTLPVLEPYTLTSDWRQYKVIGNGLSLTDQYEIIWYPHSAFDTTNAGCNFYAVWPQQADDDSDYVATTTTSFSNAGYGASFLRTAQFQTGITIGSGLPSATPTLTSGSGAPVGACITGSIYMRTDGGTGTSAYVCESTVWVGK